MSSPKHLVILKIGSTFPKLAERKGDFEDRMILGLGLPSRDVAVHNALADRSSLPNQRSLSGLVITGSHEMITDHPPWSERIAGWLPEIVARGIPVLGICYGHQLLAHALGGEVANNPNGLEFGTVEIRTTAAAAGDRLFSGCPDRFKAHVTHTQSVIKLPPEAALLAASSRDPHQAFSVGTCAWGLQFHPEFDVDITTAYIRRVKRPLERQGDNPEQLIETGMATPDSAAILRRFAQIVSSRNPGTGSSAPKRKRLGNLNLG